ASTPPKILLPPVYVLAALSVSVPLPSFDTSNAADGNFATDAATVLTNNLVGGVVGLSKLGSGTLTLNAASTYTGGNRIFGGVLAVGNASALGSGTGGMAVNAGTLNLNGFSIQVGNLSGSSAGVITNTASGNATLTVSPLSTTTTYPGSIVDTAPGNVSLTKIGTNTLILSGTNTYSGSTAILAGTLQANNPASLPGAVSMGATSAILALNFASGSATTFANQVTGTGAVNLLGSGTTILTNTTSSYTGNTFVQAGVLQISSLTNSGTNGVLGRGTTINLGSSGTGGTLRYTGGVSSTSNRVVNLAGTTGGATIEAAGAGALVLTSNLTATGAGNKTLTLTGSSVAANMLQGAIVDSSGTTSLVKTGAGRWTLSAASTYTGSSAILAGTVIAAVDTPKGAASGAFGLFNDGGSSETGRVQLGDTADGAVGTAALLLDNSVWFGKRVRVTGTGVGATQVAILGGANTSGTTRFAAQDASATFIYLGRDVTLQAATSGAVEFGNQWVNAAGTYDLGATNLTVGTAGNNGKIR
ncbi:MAG: hypothetical protein EBZ59_11985, partial [Planctomycetia bacterium]|nr:hypothetical protein [Planctomycetia bacterium]